MKLTKSLFLILFLATLGITFSSCSNDDNDDAQNRDLSKFVGTWNIVKVDPSVALTDKFKTELEEDEQKAKIEEYEDAMKKLILAAGEEMKPATLVLNADGKFNYEYQKLVNEKPIVVNQSGVFEFNTTYTEIILKTTSEKDIPDVSYTLVGSSLLTQKDKKADVVATIEGLEYETEVIKENEKEKEVEKVKVDKAIQGLIFSLKK